eukprot:33842_1
MTLSFHVESSDEIKCYLYWKGGFIRFLPDDVISLLPLLFNAKVDGNKEFATCQEAADLVKYLTPKMRDYPFESFYNEYKLKKAQIHSNNTKPTEPVNVSRSSPSQSSIPIHKASNSKIQSTPMSNLYDEKNEEQKQEISLITESKSEPPPTSKSAIESGPLQKLIFWLSVQHSSTNYALHWNLFKAMMYDNYEDDDELDVDTLIEDFADEDNCEYIAAMKNDEHCKGNYKQYIQELTVELTNYKTIATL